MNLVRSGPLAALLALLLSSAGQAADIEKYLPDDTDMVMALHVKPVIDSALVKRHLPSLAGEYGPAVLLAMQEKSPEIQRAIQANKEDVARILRDPAEIDRFTGFLKDTVSTVVVATNTQGGDANRFFMGIFGDWGRGRVDGVFVLLCLADPSQFKMKKLGDQKYYVLKSGNDAPIYFAAPEDGVIILSQAQDVIELGLARAAGKSKPALKKDMRTLVKGLDPTKALNLVAVNNQAQITMRGHVAITRDVRAELTVETADPAIARELAKEASKGIDSLKELVAVLAGDNAKLKAFAQTVSRGTKVSTQGRNLVVSTDVSGKAIDDLLGQ